MKNVGQVLFAVTMIGLGILGFVTGDFAPMWQPVPLTWPARVVLAYFCAGISLASGVGLLSRRTTVVASRVLLGWLLAWLLLVRVPQMVLGFAVDTWWAAAEMAVLVGAAWVLYSQSSGLATGEPGLRIARALYGLGLIPFGLAHFIYLDATTVLIPGWLPGHVAWAYFTGAAFIAAGIGMLVGVWARLAAVLSVVMVGLFTLVVWVPIVLRGDVTPFHWHEFISSVTITVAGWVVAESYRGRPWLGRRSVAKA
jgi:uncharacterized membrane protein